ncbi:MAG: hypothetical protein EPN97_13710 [Alphaproteobacteria bacterium]|nr:MAG: hypothetical protein EPN97_13710 [Alphaproteobacteria bacterium]
MALAAPAKIKDRLKRKLRPLVLAFCAAAGVSGVTQVEPSLVSHPLSEYAATQGLPQDLGRHFHAASIDIYRRHNALYPFHFAGQAVRWEWQDRWGKDNIALLAAKTPVIFAQGLFRGVEDALPFSDPVGAFSLAVNVPVEERACFVRPPDRVYAEELVNALTGLGVERLRTVSDPERLADGFLAFALLHEGRHCDQDKRFRATAVLEADADIYAFRVLEARPDMVDADTLNEMRDIWTQARVLEGVAKGGGHFSPPALKRGGQTGLDAHESFDNLARFRAILDDTLAGVGPSGSMTETEARYHAAKAIMREPVFAGDTALLDMANAFVSAVDFFDQRCGGRLVTHKGPEQPFDFSFFRDAYKPVPDRIAPVSGAPKTGGPAA